jgi:ribose-phosphate pyrophosphokinase
MRKTGKQVELLCVEKRRTGQVISGGEIVGDPSGRDVIVLDDMCASGSTLLQAATVLRAAGATSVHTAVTHTPIETGVAALAASDHVTQVVTTDSVGHTLSASACPNSKVTTLSTGELLGTAIARIANGDSLAPLAEDWPPPSH